MPFTKATAFEAESARVAIITCVVCGAAILLDPRDDVNMRDLHDAWHQDLEFKFLET